MLRLWIVAGLFVLSACGTDTQPPNGMHVKVIDGQGKGVANATVVIGTQTGAMESVLSTDARGEAYFPTVPGNATVTAAFSCLATSANRTYYNTDIAYGVNVPAVKLMVGTCEEDNRQVKVNVTDGVAGITARDATLGPITYSGSTVTLYVSGGVQDDGNVSAFASGYDDQDNIKGYGFALDRPAADGTVIDLVIDRTDLVGLAHRFKNIPPKTMSYYCFALLIRKQAMTSLPYNGSWGAATLPSAVTTYHSAAFADNNMFNATVMLDQDDDGKDDANVGLVRYRRNASAQVFDFSLTPSIPRDLVYSPGTAGRPAISWSNGDPLATVQRVTVRQSATTPLKTRLNCTMSVPPSAASLVFPELPDALAAFRPGGYSTLSLETMKFDGSASYRAYLEAIAAHDGRFYEAAGFDSYGFTSISRQP